MNTVLTVAYLTLFAVAAAIGIALVTIRTIRTAGEARRQRRAALPRRELLAFVAEPDADGADTLVAMPLPAWRAAEPTALALLGKLRGDAHTELAAVFVRRGAGDQAIRRTRDKSRVVRAAAAQLLGDLRYQPAVPELVRLLNDRSLEVSVVAVRSLGHIGDPVAAVPMLRRLREGQPLPAQVVARALGQCGADAAPALIDALAVGPPAVQVTALQALGMLGVPRAQEAVAALLCSDTDLTVRVAAARTLGELSTREALPPLLNAVGDTYPTVLRAASAAALGTLGAVSAVSTLGVLLGDPEYQVAHAAGRSLRRLGSAGLAELRRVAADPTHPGRVHAQAAAAMSAIMNPPVKVGV